MEIVLYIYIYICTAYIYRQTIRLVPAVVRMRGYGRDRWVHPCNVMDCLRNCVNAACFRKPYIIVIIIITIITIIIIIIIIIRSEEIRQTFTDIRRVVWRFFFNAFSTQATFQHRSAHDLYAAGVNYDQTIVHYNNL